MCQAHACRACDACLHINVQSWYATAQLAEGHEEASPLHASDHQPHSTMQVGLDAGIGMQQQQRSLPALHAQYGVEGVHLQVLPLLEEAGGAAAGCSALPQCLGMCLVLLGLLSLLPLPLLDALLQELSVLISGMCLSTLIKFMQRPGGMSACVMQHASIRHLHSV